MESERTACRVRVKANSACFPVVSGLGAHGFNACVPAFLRSALRGARGPAARPLWSVSVSLPAPALYANRRLIPQLPWAIGAAAIAALIFFDLGPRLAFNDDWLYAWSTRELIEAHRVHMFPLQAALALVQVVWAALFTLGHPDPRLLRLSVVPFVLLASYATYRLARGLGAGPFWSALAAVSLLATPLYLTGATSFMSDSIYIGLLMAVALTGCTWIERGTGRLTCIVLTALCILQRQLGVLLPLAFTVTFLLTRGKSGVARRDWLGLAGMWAGALVAWTGPIVLHWAPATQAPRLTLLLSVDPIHQILMVLVYLPALLGLCFLPLVTALAFQAPPLRRGPRAVALAGAVLAAIAYVNVVIWLAHWVAGHGYMIYPGNVWTPVGFTPTVGGDKVPLFPGPVFAAIQVLTVLTFSVLLLQRRLTGALMAQGRQGTLLVALAASQLVPLFLLYPGLHDRYYLPVVAPLVPLLATLAARTRHPRLAGAWALLVLLCGLGLYVLGQQDYEAWQVAADRAARLAYQTAAPAEVQAGYEANGVYAEVPAYEQSGRLIAPELLALGGFAVSGPAHPRLRLRYAPPDDPRPGVDYRSFRSGRIVIAPGEERP